MHVVVTGAAGFIGSHLCERLLADGHTVTGLDNFDPFYDPARKHANVAAIQSVGGDRFTLRSGDVRDAAFVNAVVAAPGVEAVVHLAALAGVRPSIANPADYEAVNVRGTLHVLEAMRAAGVRRLVFASSSSVYGNRTDAPFREDQPTDRPISPYAATKKAGELLCHTWHALHGLQVACLRFFTVYGPRQRPDLAIAKFTRLVERGEPVPAFGDGGSSRDYTFVTDTVAGVVKGLAWTSATEPRFDVFNLGNAAPVSLADLLRHVEAAVGRSAVVQRMPKQPGDVELTWADCSKAARVLGHVPQVAIGDGIARYVQWWRAQAEHG